MQPGNNIGYLWPYERLLREPISKHRDFTYFKGCGAGLNTIAIEVERKIKGCPSLPSAQYTNGNIRERSFLLSGWNRILIYRRVCCWSVAG